ncbi:hypothetical protein [Paenibacillus larvae]|uniref:hypothetical protein n=1 Tax=Paenibacillus larvae TaxID=1464 RepID=UPI0028933946|nr:hypothetical protein [Paenibacillus larvae]
MRVGLVSLVLILLSMLAYRRGVIMNSWHIAVQLLLTTWTKTVQPVPNCLLKNYH